VTANICFALLGAALVVGATLQLFRMFKSGQVVDIFGIVYTRAAKPERFWLRFVIYITVIPIGVMFFAEAVLAMWSAKGGH
jgi:hypothetical protein